VVGLVTRRRREREFDEELRSHVEMHTAEGIHAGLSPAEARRQALVMLGGAQQVREAHSDGVTLPWLESVLQDVRFAVRMLAKAPGFTAVAVFVLALGIGANAAVFSLINALLLRPLNGTTTETPMGVFVGDRTRPDAWRFFSYPEYIDVRQQAGLFTSVIAETGAQHPGLEENGRTRRISARVVSSNYFYGLGGVMAAGRGFTAAEEHPNAAAAVAVVGYPFWRQHGFDPALIGSSLRLNGRPFTVVGVAPEGFTGLMPLTSSEVWLPFGAVEVLLRGSSTAPGRVTLDRDVRPLLVTAFLRDGVTAAAATGRLDSLAAGMPPAVTGGRAQLVVGPRSRTAMGISPDRSTNAATAATVLMLLALVVLIVACLNLANMLLARGSVRRPEIALRLALGGSRGRIVRQLLTEGVLLSVLGGAVALLLAWVAARHVTARLDSVAGSNAVISLTPDWRVFAAVAVACLVSTMAFSLGPAWTLSRPDVASGLKTAGLRGRKRRVPVPDLLVGAQVALSLAMLVGTALFVRAGAAAAVVDPGYTLEDGLLVETDMEMIGASPSEGLRLYSGLVDRLRAQPGVRAATLASIVPFGSYRDGRLVRSGSNQIIFATYTVVGAEYVETLGLQLLTGRSFTRLEEQSTAASPVALVDQTLVNEMFPGTNPIGQVLHLLRRPDDPDVETVEIVGVVPAILDDAADGVNAHVYVPFGSRYRSAMTLRVKTEPGAQAAVALPIRNAIAEVDRRVPVLSVQTLTDHRNASEAIVGIGILSAIFGAFGAIALFLASIGVYGLRAYLVAERTREFGIRLALGAPRGTMMRQILGEGGRLALAGMAIGALLAAGLTILLKQSGMLLDASPVDPLVMIGAPLVLIAATALASYIPARRALRIEPVTALRTE
jgi:predicted permease